MNHFILAFIVLICFCMAIFGVWLIGFVVWSLLCACADHFMERHTRARMPPPSHVVGRPYVSEWFGKK